MAAENLNHAKMNKDAQAMTITFVPEIQPNFKPDNMEEYVRSYFEGINGINRRIIAEERKIIAQNRNTWSSLSVEERDKLLNDRFISTDVRQKYSTSDEYWKGQTPWRAEELPLSQDLQPAIPKQRVDNNSMSLNDSFSKPFQWATKSQRNIKFPAITREKARIMKENEAQAKSSSKESEKTNMAKPVKEADTVQKLNNVTQSIKEKQIKTKNDNIEGKIEMTKPAKSTVVENKPQTSTSSPNENANRPDDQGISTEQPKAEGSEYMDGSTNIFEFLQSWNP